jgi:[acyl-carrier-protein] S-malonyltransferase
MSKLLGAVFPGQGSQQVGMLASLATAHPQVGETFQEASAALRYDLWQLVQEGPAEQLALTHITQPAILASSVAIWRVWQAQGGAVPALMAGHSLGEYSALVCSGALAFAEAVTLVRQRGEFMQSAVPVGAGAMSAIVGLEDAAVVQACAEASGEGAVVAAVNFNSPGQVVIAGHAAAVARAGELCKAAGAKRALPLPVSAPFHSPLMQPAAERFAAVLAEISIQAPRIPVIHNFGLAATQDPATIRSNLVSQIHNPVPWVDTIQRFAQAGIGLVLEIGPGKVLCGLNKRIEPAMEALAVNEPDNLQAALAAVQAQ